MISQPNKQRGLGNQGSDQIACLAQMHQLGTGTVVSHRTPPSRLSCESEINRLSAILTPFRRCQLLPGVFRSRLSVGQQSRRGFHVADVDLCGLDLLAKMNPLPGFGRRFNGGNVPPISGGFGEQPAQRVEILRLCPCAMNAVWNCSTNSA